MKTGFACLLALALLLSMAACHAPDETLPTPTIDGNETTAPTMTATIPTVPTDPTMPKELVAEAREDGLIYVPSYHNRYWNGYFNGMQLRIDLAEDCFPGKTITYVASTNYGTINSYTTYDPAPMPLENKKNYYWTGDDRFGDITEDLGEVLSRDGSIFVDVVIYADDTIVGYGIFEIGTDGDDFFGQMRSETVIFPMFNGKFQEVSEAFVAEKIAELKQTVTPFDLEAKKAEYEVYCAAAEEARRKQYFEERKPLDPSAVIQITSSQDVLEEDPAVAQLKKQFGYQFVYDPIYDEEMFSKYGYYRLGSSEDAFILLDVYIRDREIYMQYMEYTARTNYGGFYSVYTPDMSNEYLGTEAAMEHQLHWVGPYDIPNIDPATIEKPDRIWIDVIVRSGDYILGFAVYELIPWENYYEGYTIVNRYDESYKLIDEHFQNVTEEFVNQRIDAYHRYAESNP